MRGIVKYSTAIAVAAALTVGLSGCGLTTKQQQNVQVSETGKTLFEADLQYIKLVNRDIAGTNDHPFAISSDNMRTVLSSIYVTKTALFNERQVPIFSAPELQILSSALSSGFSRAEASEDMTFVTVGVHQGTLAKERQVNSGRVFMSGGRLNIIFGMVQEEYRDKDQYTGQAIDRRVNPLLPGTRRVDSKPSTRVALDNGMAYYVDPQSGNERTDWIVIDIATVLSTSAERSATAQEGYLSPELREDIARNKQENKNLREDISNLKEVLFEMSGKLDKLQKELDASRRR